MEHYAQVAPFFALYIMTYEVYNYVCLLIVNFAISTCLPHCLLFKCNVPEKIFHITACYFPSNCSATSNIFFASVSQYNTYLLCLCSDYHKMFLLYNPCASGTNPGVSIGTCLWLQMWEPYSQNVNGAFWLQTT